MSIYRINLTRLFSPQITCNTHSLSPPTQIPLPLIKEMIRDTLASCCLTMSLKRGFPHPIPTEVSESLHQPICPGWLHYSCSQGTVHREPLVRDHRGDAKWYGWPFPIAGSPQHVVYVTTHRHEEPQEWHAGRV